MFCVLIATKHTRMSIFNFCHLQLLCLRIYNSYQVQHFTNISAYIYIYILESDTDISNLDIPLSDTHPAVFKRGFQSPQNQHVI